MGRKGGCETLGVEENWWEKLRYIIFVRVKRGNDFASENLQHYLYDKISFHKKNL